MNNIIILNEYSREYFDLLQQDVVYDIYKEEVNKKRLKLLLEYDDSILYQMEKEEDGKQWSSLTINIFWRVQSFRQWDFKKIQLHQKTNSLYIC